MQLISLLITLVFTLAIPGIAFTQYQIELAFPNLTFSQPVDLQFAPDSSDRLFVVEQAGRIFSFANEKQTSQKNLFLDITDRVNDIGSEEGLLGLAFHPQFRTNGYFFVDYTAANPRRSVISRFRIDLNNPNQADPNSEFVLLEVNQPFSNHNGGQIQFGPDGYLYIGLGDGGSGGDPLGNGQNRQTLLGALLRIDVDKTSPGKNYAIPPDNPFAGNTNNFREEIYAYGLRNPWRFTFDLSSGWLWLADVGQNRYEEVNIIRSGGNYGWNIMEGFQCFSPPTGCNSAGLEMPVWVYNHSVGQSITGGYVYRGTRVPELYGKYIYGDFVSGRIWSLSYDGTNPPQNSELLNTSLAISTFGRDENNRLFIVDYGGRIFQFEESSTKSDATSNPVPQNFSLLQNYPNPFNPTTTIPFQVQTPGYYRLEVFDTAGRIISTPKAGFLPPGLHEVVWNTPAPAGIYLYRLQGENRSQQTRKMVLLK